MVSYHIAVDADVSKCYLYANHFEIIVAIRPTRILLILYIAMVHISFRKYFDSSIAVQLVSLSSNVLCFMHLKTF